MKTTAKMQYIAPKLIRANSRRNFELNPLRAEQVTNLVESYRRNGQKEALSVRALADGTYELAAGHHRLAAMGGLTDLLPAGFDGETFTPARGVRCLVEDMDEDQMVRWMIDENSTQPGSLPGVDVDSIAAVVHRVAYLLISGIEAPDWFLNCPVRAIQINATPEGWEESRHRLYSNEGRGGLGRDIIRAYGVGGMSRARVERAIANLKALEHGGMADIIKDAREEYEAKIAVEQAKEAHRLEEIKRQQAEEERKAKEAEKRRKELERQRKEAEKAKDQARIEAQRKLREKAEQEERDRAERIKEQAAERERIEKHQAAEAERVRKAKEAEEKMRQQAREKGIHISLLNEMNGSELEHFRRSANAHGYTVEQQPSLWSDIKRAMDEIPTQAGESRRAQNLVPVYVAGRAHGGDHDAVVHAIRTIRDASGEPVVREQEIRAFLDREKAKKDAKARKVAEESQRRWEAEQWERKADRVMDEVGAAFGRLHSALNAMQTLMNEANGSQERVARVIQEAQTSSLRKNLDVTEGTIKDVRKVFSLWQSSMAKGSTYDVDFSVVSNQ